MFSVSGMAFAGEDDAITEPEVSDGCAAIGVYAVGATVYLINSTLAGKAVSVGLTGANIAGSIAVAQKFGESIGGKVCEKAKNAWLKATKKAYDEYGGRKRPGELAVGGSIMGVQAECFLSIDCKDNDPLLPPFIYDNMSYGAAADSFYYNYQVVHQSFVMDPISVGLIR